MQSAEKTPISSNLFEQALFCLKINDPIKKTQQVRSLQERWLASELKFDPLDTVLSLPVPGRPETPVLVSPRQVPKRNFTTHQGKLSLVHAIAHIEFNAINLALDAVYRFQNMPIQYYTDWCRVAVEESEHFLLLTGYLQDNSMYYGDLAAHNGLWEMACKTDFDVMVRMALVPRVLEARGLDVTPGMIKKLQKQADEKLVLILERIFEDEIGHVKIGSYWFNALCEERGLIADETFSHLLDTYMQDASFGPFDLDARQQAGFSEKEIQNLIARC